MPLGTVRLSCPWVRTVGHGIKLVLRVVARPQMRWIDADRVSARVKDMPSVWDWTDLQLVHKAMGAMMLVAHPELSIAVVG